MCYKRGMAGIILLLMVILYFYGYVQIPGVTVPNPTLFIIQGQPVVVSSFLIFFAILWTITVLPPILRIIGIILLVAWTLTELGFVVIAGLSNFIAITIIISLFVIIFR
jgi:hypothetical protein